MSTPRVILLPGLHGTTSLFDRFVAAAPANIALHCQSLPNDIPLDYHELAAWVTARLPAEPFVLIAESFSGPLALLIADRCENVLAIALVVTFVVPPAPGFIARIPQRVWSISPPTALVSAFLTGGDNALAVDCRGAIESVPPDVIAKRIDEAVHVDVRAELARFTRPLLCLGAKQDWIVPRRSMAKIRAMKPCARLVELNGPHMLLQTRAEEAWLHIEPFLRSVSVAL
ncbi:MAG: hypothetical protein ABIQ10_05900 [Gemmatimonadaceae bacterium]